MPHRSALLAALLSLSALTLGGCASDASSSGHSMPWGSPDLTSQLQIPAAQQFLYAGEKDTDAYTAVAYNRGDQAVVISEELDGKSVEVVTLAPGQTATHRFAPGQTAIFRNTSSTQEAQLTVRIWGPTNVGMRYTPAAPR